MYVRCFFRATHVVNALYIHSYVVYVCIYTQKSCGNGKNLGEISPGSRGEPAMSCLKLDLVANFLFRKNSAFSTVKRRGKLYKSFCNFDLRNGSTLLLHP